MQKRPRKAKSEPDPVASKAVVRASVAVQNNPVARLKQHKNGNGSALAQKGHKPLPIPAETRGLIEQLLNERPRKTLNQIADIAGVAQHTVAHVLRMQGDVADRHLSEYARRLRKRLPVSERVRLYSEIALGKAAEKKAYAQIAALKRVEELEGIVTAKERRESEANQVQLPGPLFHVVVQPGASMAVMAAPVKPQQVVVESEGDKGSKDGASVKPSGSGG